MKIIDELTSFWIKKCNFKNTTGLEREYFLSCDQTNKTQQKLKLVNNS